MPAPPAGLEPAIFGLEVRRLELIGNTTEGDAEEKRHEKLDYALSSATPAYPLCGLSHLSAFLFPPTVCDVP